MNRRTKDRVDLRLQCRLGPQKVLSVTSATQAQVIGLTQNVSRCGLLMRWLDTIELPAPGSDLTVDIDLPADASFGPRLMRCRTTVVRIIRSSEGLLTVGMKIRNIRFVAPTGPARLRQAKPRAADRLIDAVGGPATTAYELEHMPTASERLN
jgi:hypothetical protein